MLSGFPSLGCQPENNLVWWLSKVLRELDFGVGGVVEHHSPKKGGDG